MISKSCPYYNFQKYTEKWFIRLRGHIIFFGAQYRKYLKRVTSVFALTLASCSQGQPSSVAQLQNSSASEQNQNGDLEANSSDTGSRVNHDKIEDNTEKTTDQPQPISDNKKSKQMVKLKDGEFRIGHAINGYPSENIKEAFDQYDASTIFPKRDLYNAPLNKESVCGFVEKKLFSKSIDLSDFFWGNDGGEAIEKLDSHLFQLINRPNNYILLDYEQYYVGRDEREDHKHQLYLHFKYPILYFCKFPPDFNWNIEKADIKKYIYRIRKSKLGGCSSQFFNGHYTDPGFRKGSVSSLYKEYIPGSTIGFFMDQNDFFLVDVRLFKYHIHYGGTPAPGYTNPAKRGIRVAKIDFTDKPLITDISIICDYHQKL